jgi:hypothetical protein
MNSIISSFLHDVDEIKAQTGHVCLSVWFNSRTAGRIWMEFGMDVKPLVSTSKS